MQNRLHSEKGFTLLEVLVAIAVLAILSGIIISSSIESIKLERSEKEVSGTMDYLTDVAMNFYIESSVTIGTTRWPNDIAEMKSYGYIPNTWSETNPWGNPYTVSSTADLFTVSTIVPLEVSNAVKRRLKLSNVVVSGGNATVTTSVVKPWTEQV